MFKTKYIQWIKVLLILIVQLAFLSVCFKVNAYILNIILIGLIALTPFIILNFSGEIDEKHEKIFEWSFIAFCFLLYFWLSLFLPYDAGPDEAMRYDIPKFIYENGRLPHGGDPSIRNIYWGISYAFTPIAGYIPGALLMRVVSFFSTSEFVLLSAARFPSVLFSTGSVYFAYKIAKDILGNKWSKLFILLFALWPEFIFISSYVNLDAMGMFSSMWIMYAMLLAKKKRWSVKSCVFLGVGCGICVMSYYNYYPVLLTAIIYSIWELISDRTIENKKSFLMTRIAIVLLIALLVGGWVFVRNYVIYNGDFLGLETSRLYGEKYAMEELKPSNRELPSIKEICWLYTWLRYTSESFIGTFGYMNIYLNSMFYTVTYIIAGFSTINLLCKSSRLCLKKSDKWNTCMFVHIVVVGLVALFYSFFFDFQAQGRYILPILPAILMLFMNSWRGLTIINKRLIGYVLVTTMVGFLLIQSYVSIFDVLLHSYI